MAVSKGSNPVPSMAEMAKASTSSSPDRISAARCSVAARISAGIVSTLFQASITTVSGAISKEPRTFSTSAFSTSVSRAAISRTCTSTWAERTSSNVARKAAIRSVGRSEINPTVSDRIAVRPDGRTTLRMVGSRVANSISFAMTAESVNRLNRVDFPALV